MAKVFDGKKLAFEKESQLVQQVSEFKKRTKITPKLVSFLVGDNPSSRLYLRLKQKAAKRIGIKMEIVKITNLTKLTEFIKEKNSDPKTHGIMIQMPLSESRILEIIKPEKDVDGLNPKKSFFLPAVTRAVLLILESQRISLRGKKVVVVGASGFVGKPLVTHLKNLGAEVIPCDEYTKNLKEWAKKGDILISATGVPGLIQKEMVKKGAVVIDAGSPRGDVDFEEVKKVASLITPVPGGVGPITIACLLENVLLAAERQINSLIRHEIN